jgi:hypothetical protein
MFSFISMNWRGRPLVSYRTIIELILGHDHHGGIHHPGTKGPQQRDENHGE